MQNYKYLIVGGGVAGTTAAETIRKADAGATIAIISDEPYRFYSRLMLSKPAWFLGHTPFDSVWLKKEEWYPTNKIDLIFKTATELDSNSKILKLDDGSQMQYDKLLLANGVYAREWTIPGSQLKGINTLRDLNHGKNVIEQVKTAKKALSIGGGFVSFEMCDMLRQANIEVTLVLREKYFWEPLLDEGSGRLIEEALKKAGVKILYDAEVVEVTGNDGQVTGAKLKDGTVLDCDMIMVGIGTYGKLDWLKTSGLAVNRGILANEYLETNLKDVWTAGDITEFMDVYTGTQVQLGNWVNAQVHGRIAGMGMTGNRQPYKAVSFYTAQGLEITVAFVGDIRVFPTRTVTIRGEATSGKHGRIIIDDKGEVTGATLINMTSEMGLISKLIEKNVKVSDRLGDLANPAFDLKTLLV